MPATGAMLWSFTAGSDVWSSPAVANGVVYIGSSGALGYPDFGATNAYMYALNAGTGALLWSLPGPGGFASPAVVNGVVYFDCSDGLCALNASTGAKLWSYCSGTCCIPRPQWQMGWFMSARSDGLYALNASTGAKLWSFPTGTYDSSVP